MPMKTVRNSDCLRTEIQVGILRDVILPNHCKSLIAGAAFSRDSRLQDWITTCSAY